MILFASLLFAQAATIAVAPALPPVQPVDFEAFEQRVRSIQPAVVQSSDGSWQCSLSASSGVAYVDDRLCQANSHCLLRSSLDPDDFGDCLDDKRGKIIKDYRRALRGDA